MQQQCSASAAPTQRLGNSQRVSGGGTHRPLLVSTSSYLSFLLLFFFPLFAYTRYYIPSMFGLKKYWWSLAILRISSCTRDGFSCVYIKQQGVNVAGSSAESYCNTGINRGVGTTSLSETYIYKTQVFSSLRHGTCPVRALPFAASSRCQTRPQPGTQTPFPYSSYPPYSKLLFLCLPARCSSNSSASLG